MTNIWFLTALSSVGEWLHLVPRWHPGSHILPWWLCPGGISQRAETLVLWDQPGKPDYLWYLDPWRPAGNSHRFTTQQCDLHSVFFPQYFASLFYANRCSSLRFSFATFSLWTCHSESRDRPWGRWAVSDSEHSLSWMCCGFVGLRIRFHALTLSVQVWCHQAFSLCMCLCLCSSPSSHLCQLLQVFLSIYISFFFFSLSHVFFFYF